MPHFPQKRGEREREKMKKKWGTRDGMDVRTCAIPQHPTGKVWY